MSATTRTPLIVFILAISFLTRGVTCFAQATPKKSPNQKTVKMRVTPENYLVTRRAFLNSCRVDLRKDAAKASADTRLSARQAMADETHFIRKHKCKIPSERPMLEQSEVHSRRFQALFPLVGLPPPMTCDDAIYAKEVLAKYWPFLAITNLSDSCGFISEPASENPGPTTTSLQHSVVSGKPVPVLDAQTSPDTVPLSGAAEGLSGD